MKFHTTALAGAYVIELERHGDERGFFARAFCQREFAAQGLAGEWVQINNSLSAQRGTLRGLHYQMAPSQEVKLVRCIRGALWDCILDVRPMSPTFGTWFGVTITAENRLSVYVPRGCAHGFISLEDATETLYCVDEYYAPERERGIRWDDPAFSIRWPIEPVVISDKDANHPDFDAEHHLGIDRKRERSAMVTPRGG
jgi:dTDP-4-dehydrorhamnose 3,5-epimerase